MRSSREPQQPATVSARHSVAAGDCCSAKVPHQKARGAGREGARLGLIRRRSEGAKGEGTQTRCEKDAGSPAAAADGADREGAGASVLQQHGQQR